MPPRPLTNHFPPTMMTPVPLECRSVSFDRKSLSLGHRDGRTRWSPLFARPFALEHTKGATRCDHDKTPPGSPRERACDPATSF
jgi:hypothetical protein